MHKRRWRPYKTAAGGCPVDDFMNDLPDDDYAAVVAAMELVRIHGVSFARHVRGDIYEVRVAGSNRIFRVLFAQLGAFQHVLLSLSAFTKKTQKTPPHEIEVAEHRLTDWRERGRTVKRKKLN